MAISTVTHSAAAVSGAFETKEASIAMTPEMFELLSAGIYEDRILAIVRELSCNGRDAQKEHAQNLGVDVETLPEMEIHVPNAFEPYFYVRDYGTGLSHDQVFDIYLSYGKSTKTGSNDFIGMFGIGSKSPLAYTDSFIVTSFKDGVETQYNVYKDKGIPKITKLVEKETEELNGLKVQVAVRTADAHSFKSRVSQFFKLFDTPVNITGEEVDVSVDFPEKNEKYWVVRGYEYGVYALMGGVPYKIDQVTTKRLREVVNAGTIILPFGIGELNIASSRENLSFTEGDATDQAINDRIDSVVQDYLDNMQQVVDNCENVVSVFNTLYDNYGLERSYYGFSIKGVTYKGLSLDDLISKYDASSGREFRVFKRVGVGASSHTFVGLKHFTDLGRRISRKAEDFIILYSAGVTKGAIKCSRAIALQENKQVILDPLPDAVADLEEVVGEVMAWQMPDVYDLYCPKEEKAKSTAARKRVSGVFIRHNEAEQGKFYVTREVTEIDNTEEGFYVDLFRDLVHFEQKDGTTKDVHRSQLEELVNTGLIPHLYFIRKSAPLKNRPKNLVRLTQVHVQELFDKVTNKKLVKEEAYSKVLYNRTRFNFPRLFSELEEVVMKDYPTIRYYNSEDATRWREDKGDLFYSLRSLGIDIKPTLDRIDAHVERANERYFKEYELLSEKYALMFAVSDYSYRFNDAAIEQVKAFTKAIIDGKL